MATLRPPKVTDMPGDQTPTLMSQTGCPIRIAMALAAASMTFPRKRIVQNFTSRFRGNAFMPPRKS
jgi:hypothetical protein